jgi:hypothetical protein
VFPSTKSLSKSFSGKSPEKKTKNTWKFHEKTLYSSYRCFPSTNMYMDNCGKIWKIILQKIPSGKTTLPSDNG